MAHSSTERPSAAIRLAAGSHRNSRHAAILVHAEHRDAHAAVRLAGDAGDASAAGQIGVDDTDPAWPQGAAVLCLDDLDGELVAHHARVFQERMSSLEDVIVGAADADSTGAHQRLIRAGPGQDSPLHLQPARLKADERLGISHVSSCRRPQSAARREGQGPARRRPSTLHLKLSMLSLVTRAAPESISDSTFSPRIALTSASTPSSAILAGNWATVASSRPAASASGLAAAEVEADQDHVPLEVGVLDRLRGAGGGRAAGGVDRLEIGVGGQDVLGDVDAVLFGAVGRALADDLDVGPFEAIEHALDAVIERRNARHALEDAERVAGLQDGLEIFAGDLAGIVVVGGGERGTALPVGNVVVHEDDLHARCDGLVQRRRDGRIDRRDRDALARPA